MNLNELINKIIHIVPNCTVGEDNDGQIIINTNLKINDHDELVDLDESKIIPQPTR